MDPTKERRFNTENETLDSGPIFHALLSAMETPEGLKPPLLKNLYYLLIHSSTNPQCGTKYGADFNDLDEDLSHHGIRVTFKDICELSNMLFKELSKEFEQLFSALQTPGQAGLHSDVGAAAEKVNLLLRCCMVILNMLVPQQYLLLENGKVLLSILRKLCSLDLFGTNAKTAISFEKLVSHECTYSDNDCTASFTEDLIASLHFLEPSDPSIPFLSAMLEVFVDELLVCRQLRAFFKLIDSVSSTSEMAFNSLSTHADIGIVMELISTHFSLSFSNEQAFGSFLNKLSWLHGNNFRAPEMSLTAAISLLLNPIMLKAPKFLQAHMISLVSDATAMGSENLKPDIRLTDCYLSAFERSVILYTKCMSSLQKDGHPIGAGGFCVKSSIRGESFQPSFESYIRPITRKKINYLITRLENSWHPNLHMFFRMKSVLAASSIAFIEENQFIIDIPCRDEILSILNCMILRASSDISDTALHTNNGTSLQDLCLLAAILKLMSSSLLQAIWCLRHSGNLGYPNASKNLSSCKEYDSIVGVLSCFREFKICLPIQKSLCEMLETHSMRHKESKLMLLHFSGLLSLSFVSGLDFVVKGCILTIMALLNLFVLEEGNLDELKSLIESTSDSFSSGLPLVSVQKAVVDPKSSLVVASNFQKMQALYLSMPPLARDCAETEDAQAETLASALVPNNMEHVVGMEEETEEVCNGEIFLKCMLQRSRKLCDFDDLVDFIECKQGKDYSCWLKDRQRYRKWKCDKMAVLRWEKKKTTWKSMKGKRS